MKTLKISIILLIAGMFTMSACTKEETETVTITKSVTDGQARILGTVKYLNAGEGTYLVAPGAVVQVAADSVNKAFNQFWVTDSVGAFNVKGLAVGSYYMNAVYTDKMGFRYTTNGYFVIVKNSVDDITLNFQCK